MNGPSPGQVLAHTAAYLAQVSVSRNIDQCVDLLKARDGAVPLGQLDHTKWRTLILGSIFR
jgi:hypothetical protein